MNARTMNSRTGTFWAPALVSLVELQTIPMANGILGVAEVSKHIGFPVHRAYYIRDVPAGESRRRPVPGRRRHARSPAAAGSRSEAMAARCSSLSSVLAE